MTDTGTKTGSTDATNTYDPNVGSLIIEYNNGVNIPIITYRPTDDRTVFVNPIAPASGIFVTEGYLTFVSPAKFTNNITVGYAETSVFIPMPIPSSPLNFNIPAISSGSTIQTTDIMVANNGVMNFYSDASGTHILWGYHG